MNNTPERPDDDLRPEYELDYTQGVRGKYYEQAMRARHLVEIDADLLEAFPTARELNAALRGLVAASRHVHVPARPQP